LDESHFGRNDGIPMPEQPEEALRPRDPSDYEETFHEWLFNRAGREQPPPQASMECPAR
jgi:hypothetical protein